MKLLILYLLLITGCAHEQSHSNTQDQFDKIIKVIKSKSKSDLISVFGEPNEISESKNNKNLNILKYKDERIDVYLDKSPGDKISHITLFYFKDYDNYAALKKRFEKYQWVEEKIPQNKTTHVSVEKYLVKIPEIGMQFEYDNNSPKRKVMWIYFE
jgi:hypothetical protein